MRRLSLLFALGSMFGTVWFCRLHSADQIRDPCVELIIETGNGNRLCPFVSTRIMSSVRDSDNRSCVYGLSVDVHPQKMHGRPRTTARFDGPLYEGTVFPVGDNLYQIDSIHQQSHNPKREGYAIARPLSEERRKEFPPTAPRALHIPMKGNGWSTEIPEGVRVEHLFKTADPKLAVVELRLTRTVMKPPPANIETRLVRLRAGDSLLIGVTTFELARIIPEDKDRKVIGWIDLVPIEPRAEAE